MLIRKDETVVERALRPSARNANIGDPFGIKFIGRDFKAAYPCHTLLVASHEDHEGPWQEFVSCDELLDCRGWDDFLEGLYGYQLDSGLDLSVTNRDSFLQLTPEWVDLLV